MTISVYPRKSILHIHKRTMPDFEIKKINGIIQEKEGQRPWLCAYSVFWEELWYISSRVLFSWSEPILS